jgi:hypothetical protein
LCKLVDCFYDVSFSDNSLTLKHIHGPISITHCKQLTAWMFCIF